MDFHLLLVVFVLFNTIYISLSADPHWDYGELGPDVWKDLYSACGGSAQSPINIKTSCTTYQSFSAFQFSSAYDLTQNFSLLNNGHTVSGTQVNPSGFPLTITGGGLTESYTFQNFHLHWGENYNSGSEHQINGKKYTGEVHFVHLNAAKTQYAVLGVLMQTTPSPELIEAESGGHRRKRFRTKRDMYNTDNATITAWKNYFAVANDLDNTNESVVASIKLASLMGTNLNNFYRYAGSLTTPPCTENVVWSVFQAPITFDDPVLDSFRSHVFFEDYRGPQLINGRTVYRNFLNDTPSTSSDYNCCGQYNQTTTATTTRSLSNGDSILSMNRQLLSYSYIFSFFIYFLM